MRFTRDNVSHNLLIVSAMLASAIILKTSLAKPVAELSIEQKFEDFNRCMQPAVPHGMRLDDTHIESVTWQNTKPFIQLTSDVVKQDIYDLAGTLRVNEHENRLLDPVGASPLPQANKDLLARQGRKCSLAIFMIG